MMIRFACFGAFIVAFAPTGAGLGYGGMRRWLSQHIRRSVRSRRMAGRFARSERVPGHITASSPLRPVLPMEPAIHDVHSDLNRPVPVLELRLPCSGRSASVDRRA